MRRRIFYKKCKIRELLIPASRRLDKGQTQGCKYGYVACYFLIKKIAEA
ncbi:MAG: hypothetical protein ABI417_12110 [Coleofasciculaceae cyanobacterium]